MKFKKILPYKLRKVLPYVFAGFLVGSPKPVGGFHDMNNGFHIQHKKEITIPTHEERIEQRATELCDLYIDYVLQGQQNIKNSKTSHRKAVRQELPGAPVGLHCIFGQYTELNRALKQLGDTLTVIPKDARFACPTFKLKMSKKYKNLPGALRNGKMFKSDADYNRALDAFLRHNKITDQAPITERQKFTKKFARANYSADSLHPGTILIIQKTANPNNTHAIMYLGRGKKENGKFVPDSNGKHMYAGFNNESFGDLFMSYDMDRVFATDIHAILVALYTQEFEKINNMNYDESFEYVYGMPKTLSAVTPNEKMVRNMAAEKYLSRAQGNYVMPVVNFNKKRNIATVLPSLHVFTGRQ